MKKYLLLGVAFFIVSVVAFSAFKQINKSSRASRLGCQKEVVVFERIYEPTKITLLHDLISKKVAKISLKAEKSNYMKTRLFEFVDPNQVQENIIQTFGLTNSENAKDLGLQVLLYENDKLDPGKKNDEAKKYAGYLVFDFYAKNQLIYKIQLDFMDLQGKDIAKRIDCAKQSLQTLN